MTFQSTWAVLVSTIFCIPCKEGLPGIWSMKFCVLFLIIPNAPITAGIIFVLSFILVLHFSYFDFKVFIFWEFSELFQWDVLIRGYCHVNHVARSFFMIFDYYIWSVYVYFSILLNSGIPWYGYIFFLLLVPVYACIISQCVVSHNVYIVSTV